MTIPCGAFAQSTPVDIPLKLFAQLPLMNDAELSPDGTHVAYLRPVEGYDYLIIQELGSKNPPRALPPPDDVYFNWIRWANDERLVFSLGFSSKRGIIESDETRLASVDRSGQDIQYIVRSAKREVPGQKVAGSEGLMPPPQIQDRIVHWMPEEPNRIMVAIDDDFDAGFAVRRIDVDTGRYRDIVSEVYGIQHWVADQNGDVRLGFGYTDNNFKMRIKVGDNWIDADKTDWWEQGYRPEAFTDDPAIAYMRGPDDESREVIRTMRLSDSEFLETIFENDMYDARRLAYDPVTRRPAGVVYSEHQNRVEYFDPTLSKMQQSLLKAFPDSAVTMTSMSEDRMRVLVLVASGVDPGVWYLWDRKSKQMAFVAERMPGLKPELLSPTTPIIYTARDGTAIPGYLTTPRGVEAKDLPTVVLPHGGPSARSDASFSYNVQFLVSRGYAVFQPNFRGSTGYGRAFRRAGRNQWGGLMQDDVTDGAKWLVEQGIADPERMCIVGGSYGGYAAAMATVKTPELFKCAVSINGVLSLVKLIADDSRYVGGTIWTDHIGLDGESAKAVSPYHQVDKITTPLMIVQAKDDARVHFDHATDMAKALKRAKKPYELVTLEGGGHTLSNEAARLQTLEAIEAFLAKHIGG